MLPGERASTVVVSAVVNSLFRWTLKTKGSFRKFLLSVVAKPKGDVRSPTSKRGGDHHVPIWPMPVPYPEVFTKKVDSDKDWKKLMVCMEVLALSWLMLGEPDGAPEEISLGMVLTPQQWNVVKMLQHLSFDSNTPEFVDASLMARAAAKFESMEDVMGSLHRSLLSFEDMKYFGDRFAKPDSFDDSWMRCGSLVGKLEGSNLTGAKPVIASRLEFPSPPSFDPVPFFDAETAELFLHPLDYAMKPADYHLDVPVVSVHGSEKEKIELYKKLASCGRLRAVDEKFARDPFVSGLFAVNKSSRLDRLILDARPPNLLERPKSFWCGTMAHAGGIADVILGPGEVLCCSGLDLKDFFYQFQVSSQRTQRNILAGAITLEQAHEIFGPDLEVECGKKPVRVALATLAMGDLLAREFSQSAHLALCLRYHVFEPGELLTLRTPVPRSKVIAGVIIDDLVVMEKLLAHEFNTRTSDVNGACDRIKEAINGYSENRLEANIKKSFFNETSCRFWGAEVDGRAGLVRSSSLRAWPLMVITMKIAMLGYSSVKLLETLAGSWIAILTMRRRMFCLLDIVFEPLGIADGNKVVALSPALQDELCSLSCTFLLAAADLRAEFLPLVSATDASCEALAAVRAPLPSNVVKECARYSLKKGTWSRLLPPGRAELRARALLAAEDELPGIGLSSHPLWSILARSLQYEEVWRSEVHGNPHINLLELKAFLKEERRLCGLHQQKRCLAGLDSQVCLGALVKGRSSSPGINRALRSSLAYPLGASFHNYFMYYLSEENRADGPTRRRRPDDPDLEQPLWMKDLASGDHQAFDAWISSLGAEFSLAPFDFRDLNNGDKTDLRPNSHLPGKERRKAREKKVSKVPTETLSSTTAEGARPSASEAGSVSPDGEAATGNTETPLTVEVPGPSIATPVMPKPEMPHSTSTTSASCNGLMIDRALREILESFPLRQFVFKGEKPDLSRPGGLDLFSGCQGVAKNMVAQGAPWVLTFDWCRSVDEDLLDEGLREKLRVLLRGGAFLSLGMAPICASFSRAVTPPVRSCRYPRGRPGLSPAMRRKVADGNSHSDFCIELIDICIAGGISYFLENPDTSWLWQLKSYKAYRDAGSPDIFRLCFCRFGTPWRKATRIATSTRLRGLRMMCQCSKRHFALRGFSSLHKKMWTKVAEPYPCGLSRLLAISLCCQAGWCEQKRLNVGGCSRCRTLRCGEAANPGPRRGVHLDRGTLEDLPLLSGHTQALEAKQLSLFVDWCRRSVRSIGIDELFDKVPPFAGQCLRSYGDVLYQHGGALSNYRHCILALQRWKPICRPYMHGPWELVRRWEFQEPVSHRPPLPEGVVKGLVTLAWQLQWYDWCGVTLIAFYGAGRLGEILRCLRSDLILPKDTIGEISHNAFLELRRFKSLNRQPSRIQHMKVTDKYCVKLLGIIYGNYVSSDRLFDGSADQYRRRWDFLLKSFSIDKSLRLTPGGLRGGSAVWAYRHGVPLPQIQWNLRLRHLATLESYIQETASLTVFSSLTPTSRSRLQKAASLFGLLCYAANRQGDDPSSQLNEPA